MTEEDDRGSLITLQLAGPAPSDFFFLFLLKIAGNCNGLLLILKYYYVAFVDFISLTLLILIVQRIRTLCCELLPLFDAMRAANNKLSPNAILCYICLPSRTYWLRVVLPPVLL